ncbi:DUF2156 domain-containing protein [Geomonas nitrogeniifigens]|uniref:DUF2156 domain-containing protein n=1 Tax=Geomonas diazotrophica TaxID=2843197 RepID=A0ABX8JE65_9BACT|nr:phosphatidylglycerol lysyltransferase domain-containing protein [Geomonas nitrogeniifigens]QWV96058.1 DUF2156 domain-containing protein [Geomonas nitrogeniifigens]QXE85126.1 DUF2156 domain-containing protein [Geomonas nitrogeniifigens]
MEIPRYPQTRGIALEDKPLLDRLFAELQPRISELTFANLYLFRKAHEYRLTHLGDAVVALGRGYDGSAYFLPPFGGDIAAATRELLDLGLTLYGADDLFLARHLDGGDGVEAIADRNNFDYLHLKDEMAQLNGKQYHKKKNRVNYFLNRHRHRVEFLDDGHLPGALALLEEWGRVRTEIVPRGAAQGGSVQGEVEGAAEALRLYRELGLSGVVVLVDDVVRGFALGERLNRETAVCHFEKGDLFMEGLYQLLDREFSRLLFTDCTYLNREQDLGEESLRQAKLSYHPVELVVKYRVKRQGL